MLRSTGSWYSIADENGKIVPCRLRGQYRIRGLKATNPIAVGDRVLFTHPSGEEPGVITAIEPRRNYIIRRSTKLSKQLHIIAANIDMAYLVATIVQPRTSAGFIDRFLVTAEAYHIPATLVFNKVDLYDEPAMSLLDKMIKIYSSAGYPCMEVSALTGQGMAKLKSGFNGRVSLLSGHSGVGKSAIINAIDPTLELKTGEISETYLKGKHTTTFAEMLPLSNGGYIIDTPGIKEFGLIDFGRDELTHFFPEMFRLLPECKFYNCTHTNEPGCAVKAAVKEGSIGLSRYTSYLNIFNGEELDRNGWE